MGYKAIFPFKVVRRHLETTEQETVAGFLRLECAQKWRCYETANGGNSEWNYKIVDKSGKVLERF